MTANDTEMLPLPSREKVLERVCAFVADAADRQVGEVGPESNLYEELGVDSLGSVAIFIDIMYEFQIPEPTDTAELSLLNTPDKLADWIFIKEPERRLYRTIATAVPLQQIKALLPYGDSFLFVDSVVAFGSDNIQTSMSWKKENLLAAAHFANGPHLVPGVLLAEQVAQSALLLSKLCDESLVERKFLLSRLQCEFLSPAHVPVAVLTEVILEEQRSGVVNFKGVCSAAGIRLAVVSGSATIL